MAPKRNKKNCFQNKKKYWILVNVFSLFNSINLIISRVQWKSKRVMKTILSKWNACVFFFKIHYICHQYVIIFNFFSYLHLIQLKTSLWINDRNYFSVINISWPSRTDGRINNAINTCLEMNQKLKIKIWNQIFLQLWFILFYSQTS